MSADLTWAELPVATMLAEYDLGKCRWKEMGPCLKVETSRGLFRLKCFAYPASEFPFIFALVQYLTEREFPRPEQILITSRGQLGITIAGQFFYLAVWQEGLTNYELDQEALIEVGELLGSFHRHSQGFQPGISIHPARTQWGKWPGKLMDRYRDLQKYVMLARMGNTPFDRLFSQNVSGVLLRAEAAVDHLKRLTYYDDVVKADERARYVCHRDFIPRNLVLDPSGILVPIDFDNAAYAERIDDLAKMIRFFAHWQPDRAEALLSGYNRWFSLQVEEVQLITAFLEFPMEYWQLGRHVYERGRTRLKELEQWMRVERRKTECLSNLRG
ncbi:MAG: phosphotransferase [Firmicutes bacterium]|nr:phosphotransferase [Bacillota bacterium]